MLLQPIRMIVSNCSTRTPTSPAFLLYGVCFLTGCAELEPMIEPEVADLQLTIDTLKTSVRDAQRTAAELRTELDARRQELADAQVARAQLEGRLHEAERRLAEARHIIDLQREELAAARTERERIARTGLQLQQELKRLHRQLAQLGRPQSRTSAAPAAGKAKAAPKASTSPVRGDQAGSRVPSVTAAAVPQAPIESFGQENGQAGAVDQPAGDRTVSVQPGDTLWSIAQRYRVDLARLRALNRLPDNRILVGQALWLPQPVGAPDSDTKAPNPVQP